MKLLLKLIPPLFILIILSACQTPPAVPATATRVPTQAPPTTLPVTFTPASTFTPAPTRTPVPTPTATVQPSETPLLSLTPLPTSTPALTPTRAPVLESTFLPPVTEPVLPENAGQVRLLAQWGKGWVEQLHWSPDGAWLGVQTTAGRYLYQGGDLSLTEFSESIWAKTAITPTFAVSGATLFSNPTKEGYQTEVVLPYDLLVISRDGTLLAGNRGPEIEVLRSKDRQSIQRFLVPTTKGDELITCDTLYRLDISPDNRFLAAGCYAHGWIYIWDIASGELVLTEDSGSVYIETLAFSPDSQWLAALEASGEVSLWRMRDLRLIHTLEVGPVWGLVNNPGLLSFSPDSRTLITAAPDASIQAWDVNSGRLVRRLHRPAPSEGGLAFSPNTRHLAITAFQEVQIWDIPSSTMLKQLALHPGQPGLAALRPEQILPVPGLLSGPSEEIWEVSYAGSGKYLAFYRDSNVVEVWNVSTPPFKKVHQGEAGQAIFAQQAEMIAVTGRFPGKINFFGLPDWSEQGEIPYQGGISTFVLAPDGQKVAVEYTLGNDELRFEGVRVQETSDGTLLAEYPGFHQPMAFSPDGQRFALPGPAGLEVWDINANTLRYRIGSDLRWAELAFSPDGGILATAAKDGVYLWNAEDGSFLRSLPHPQPISALVFSPDGKYLAALSAGTVLIWGITK